MSALSRSRRRVALASVMLVVTTALAGFAGVGVASATDYGVWYYNSYNYPGGNFYRYAGYGYPQMASAYRDSDFSDNYYSNGLGLNDGVYDWVNGFSTLHLQAFLDANYGRASFCLAGGYAAGPYPIQQRDGVSSFKSC